jgi:hypothetical protein
MSHRNGNRSRDDRKRKENIDKRARSRELRKVLQERHAATVPSKAAGKTIR